MSEPDDDGRAGRGSGEGERANPVSQVRREGDADLRQASSQMTPSFAFLFEFEPRTGDDPDDRYWAEANTLADAVAMYPHLAPLPLAEVWCLQTCNLVWASEGAYHNGPWRDSEHAHA